MNEDVTMPNVPLVALERDQGSEPTRRRSARRARSTPFGWTLYTLAAGAVIALAVLLAVR